MSTTIYLLEPGATPPPPRPVITSARARLLLICGAVLFTAIFLGGMVAMVEAGQITWLAIAGQRITAHITKVDGGQLATAIAPKPAATGQPGDGPSPPQSTGRIGIGYTFDEPFEPGQSPRTQYGWTDAPTPPSGDHLPDTAHNTAHQGPPVYHVGDRLTFRYAVVGGHVIMHAWASPPYGMLFLLLAIGLTLMSVGALFTLRLWRWHGRRMLLLRNGLAVTGSVVSKRVDGLEGKYYLTYSYLARTEAAIREREEQCTPTQWKLFAEQDPVTVLYDPNKTDTVGLYKLLAEP